MPVDEDVEIDDLRCPACGHHETLSRSCWECEDGHHDLHDEDPINYAPGEEFERCAECSGHGIVRWCPACGRDYWRSLAAAEKAARNARKH